MTRGFIFWLVMLLWFLAWLGVFMAPRDFMWAGHASSALLFLLLGLLGWQVYGPAVKG